MNELQRIDTIDGARGVYDGERWVATFKRAADLEEYLTLKCQVADLRAKLEQATHNHSEADDRACGYAVNLEDANARVRQLETEQAEDRAAIREMADVLVLFLHPGEPDCAACRVAKDHAAAITRAGEKS